MITAEQARKNLVPMDDVVKDYLAREIEPKIREASYKKTSTEFRLAEADEGWIFDNFLTKESWKGYAFSREKFTSEAINVLEKNGYKTEIKEEYNSVYTWGVLVVSWERG